MEVLALQRGTSLKKRTSGPPGFLWRLHYKAMIDLSHWPLVVKLNLQPLSPSGSAERDETEFQISNHTVGSPGNQPPQLVQKSSH